MQVVRNEETYQELIKKIKGMNLLALPQSASRVLELSKDPTNGPPEFAIPISADIGLTSQVLKFVNSSFFGFRYKITTIQMALSLVCVRTIKNFVLWNAVFALLPNPKSGPFDLKILGQDSLRRGSFAKVLADSFQEIDSEELFVAALLQDMALPVLAQLWPEEYENILTRHQETGEQVSTLEKEIFGWDHAEVGSILVKEWGFGEELAAGIAFHTENSFSAASGKARQNKIEDSIIALSSMIPSVLDSQWTEADAFFAAYNRFHRKGLPNPGEIFAAVDEMFADLLSISQYGQPKNSIVGFHRQYLDSMSG